MSGPDRTAADRLPIRVTPPPARVRRRTLGWSRLRLAPLTRRGRNLAAVAAAAISAAALGAPCAVQAQPVASFLWFPPSPQVGEPVSLASTSTDFSSPI